MKGKGRLWALLLCLALLVGCGAEEPQATADAPAPALTAPTAEAETAAPPAATTEEPIVPEPGDSSLVLWYAQDMPAAEAFTMMASAYAGDHPDRPLFIHAFASTEELRTAMSFGRPDLLLCDGALAASLAEEGRLAGSEPAAELRPVFRDGPAGFQPLGAVLPVLTVRQDQRDQLPEVWTLEALCAAASGYGRRMERPYFSADSFASLFSGTLHQKDSPFYAMREQDLESEAYREVYNLLADAAFEGGLVSLDEPVLSAVERGDLICGICSSQELLNTDREALAVLPLPPLAGCELQAEGEIWGLALLAGENTESAEDFLGEALALPSLPDVLTAAGLLPAWGDSWGGAEDFSAVLETGRICISGEESGYAYFGAKFEQSFRAALALLG